MTVSYNVNIPIKATTTTSYRLNRTLQRERKKAMNYATDYTVILTALYILIVAIAFAPKCPHVSPDSPVEYFPEIEAVEPYIKTETVFNEPVESVETYLVNLPVMSSENFPIPQAIASDELSLTSLGIRELKKLASTRKIKRYGSLNKQQLIFALV
jgi:hypothetical protein